MVLDMCGFSRLTARYGIIHFLSMIHRLHGIVLPIIAARRRHGGQDRGRQRLRGLPRRRRPQSRPRSRSRNACDAANVFLPDDWDLHASLGIGYGELLMIGDDDLYGNEMNIASKLGEDIAGRGEVFLSDAAHARVAGGNYEPRQIPISAMTVTAHNSCSDPSSSPSSSPRSPLAKYRRPHAHQRRALGDRHLQIVAHAHRQMHQIHVRARGARVRGRAARAAPRSAGVTPRPPHQAAGSASVRCSAPARAHRSGRATRAARRA